MKTFLRTGAFYRSETPSLTDDLDITDLFNTPIKTTYAKGDVQDKINDMWKKILELPPPIEKQCNCKRDIEDLNKRIDGLVKLVNEKPKEEKAKSMTVAKKEAPKKTVVKKPAAKKK